MPEPVTLNMPLAEAIQTQRAIRRLKPDPVDDDLVLRLIDLAVRAPTGSNAQNWEFIIVRDPAIKKAFARRNRLALQGNRWLPRGSAPPTARRRRIMESVSWQADHFEEIPVIVVACLRGFYLPFIHLSATSYFGSIFPAVQNLLLAARAAGLGAALITVPLWNLFAARRTLGLPWNVTPCAMIPLGWPIDAYGLTTRKPVHEVVSYDRYGNRAAAPREPEGPSSRRAGS
jgi:nitroreductase